MDSFHERLARDGLAALEQYGFVLAGGYVFHLHRVTTRISQDVDLFTDRFDAELFATAEHAIVNAYRQQGLQVTVGKQLDVFRQIQVTDPDTGISAIVDLGFDSRDHPPVRLDVGPVLALEDAAASKIRTLIDREAARDYIDVHALLASGRFTPNQLVELTSRADPNVTNDTLAAALERSTLAEEDDYQAYGLTTQAQRQLHTDLAAAANALRQTPPDTQPVAQVERPHPSRHPSHNTGPTRPDLSGPDL